MPLTVCGKCSCCSVCDRYPSRGSVPKRVQDGGPGAPGLPEQVENSICSNVKCFSFHQLENKSKIKPEAFRPQEGQFHRDDDERPASSCSPALAVRRASPLPGQRSAVPRGRVPVRRTLVAAINYWIPHAFVSFFTFPTHVHFCPTGFV